MLLNESSTPVYLARQPIIDLKGQVFGYELLYRRGQGLGPGDMAPSDSARSIASALVDIGLAELVGKGKAFINVDASMIQVRTLEAFPKDQVVIEILESVEATPDVLKEVARLKELGYRFALDDFVKNESTLALLPLVDVVKVDISQYTELELDALVAELNLSKATLLAERVETQSQMERCRALGFSLFQGFFFAKPELVEGRALSCNQTNLIRLIGMLNEPNLTLEELEGIILSEVELSVRLLRLMKSAYLGLPPKVDTIRQMLLFIGVHQLAAVATVLLMSHFSSKSPELIHIALLRAKLCEKIGRQMMAHRPDRFFTVGMLSIVDALLDRPMATVLAQLPLTDEIQEVLLNPESDHELAKALRIAMYYEAGDFEAVEQEGYSLYDAHCLYLQANRWAMGTLTAVAA